VRYIDPPKESTVVTVLQNSGPFMVARPHELVLVYPTGVMRVVRPKPAKK
jgi:hypothetical protein